MKKTLQAVKAAASSMIGVGKKNNLVQDFESVEKTGPWPFIIAGLVMTVLFIGSLVFIVQLVLP
ncbi:MAG: hypothetical protein CMO25_02150 [Thiotrichales bacterium]|jgi:hypothetical protein|nr:hypothetical protein [Thiotrichales bacterium]MDP6163471.1 DUF2970 domain-containing protein [Candidatus Thioglobus sp.]|tara:strand:+ start:1119 stop:1310 length:192 start_codon:yes stop_codon:yes gene_type:complete